MCTSAGVVIASHPSVRIVLCVDDDPEFVQLLCRALASDGLAVVGAPTAEAASILCEEQRIDVLVTDLDLPRGTGLELIAEVRERDPTLPILVVTASASAVILEQAMAAGASLCLTKPVDFATLKAWVCELIVACDSCAAAQLSSSP